MIGQRRTGTGKIRLTATAGECGPVDVVVTVE